MFSTPTPSASSPLRFTRETAAAPRAMASARRPEDRSWSDRLRRVALSELARLTRDRKGAVAMIVAFLAVPLMLIVTAGVNFARAEIAKERLQAALDSAALTLARADDSSPDARAVVQSFINANLRGGVLPAENVTFNVAVETALNGKKAAITAGAKVDVLFSDAFGIDDIAFSLGSEAMFARQDMEISLVLDVSGSMNGSRLSNMKSATKQFLDIVLGDPALAGSTFVNIVPYSGSVHLGAGFASHLSGTVDPLLWSGCLDTRSEIMDDGLIADGYGGVDGSYIRWGGFGNTWCPPASSALQIHRNDLGPLKTFVEGMQMGDGTGTDGALAWGLKTLSPDWRGSLPGAASGRPADYGDGTVKALIVMTDGRITDQWRPDGVGGHSRAYDQATAESNFEDVCAEAHAKPGLTVYAVGFEVTSDDMLSLLRNCATDETKYFEADGAELATVFTLIARQLSELRISK